MKKKNILIKCAENYRISRAVGGRLGAAVGGGVHLGLIGGGIGALVHVLKKNKNLTKEQKYKVLLERIKKGATIGGTVGGISGLLFGGS